MVLLNTKKLRILALFVAIFAFSAIGSANTQAATGTFSENGLVWDYDTGADNDKIIIGVNNAMAAPNQTVKVPSLAQAIAGVGDSSLADLDTYYLDSLCYDFDGCVNARTSTSQITTLDMTDTSKIQVKNVSRMFSPDRELNVYFGENMVIADPADLNLSDSSYGDGMTNPYNSYTGAFEGMKLRIYPGENSFATHKPLAATYLLAPTSRVSILMPQTLARDSARVVKA